MPWLPRFRRRQPALESLEGRQLLNARFDFDGRLAPGWDHLGPAVPGPSDRWPGSSRHELPDLDGRMPAPLTPVGPGARGAPHGVGLSPTSGPAVLEVEVGEGVELVLTRGVGLGLVPVAGSGSGAPDAAPRANASDPGVVRLGTPRPAQPEPGSLRETSASARAPQRPGTAPAPIVASSRDGGPVALPVSPLAAPGPVVVPPAPAAPMAEPTLATPATVGTHATTLTAVHPAAEPSAVSPRASVPHTVAPGRPGAEPPGPVEPPQGRAGRPATEAPLAILPDPAESAAAAPAPQGSDLLGEAPPLDGNVLDALLDQLLGGLEDANEPEAEHQAGLLPELFVTTVALAAAEGARRWRERRRTVPIVPTWNPGGPMGRSRRV